VYKDVRGGEILSADSSVIYWDGTNRNKRVVGNGTYLGIIKVWYHTQGTQPVRHNEKIFIGVKQQ
ncbi:MAG: hypothetical protein N2053_00455, partial [Chitinispirillaceae bacterium]|nr:hypothetical protein [Chitinispirillaceae bacterium]